MRLLQRTNTNAPLGLVFIGEAALWGLGAAFLLFGSITLATSLLAQKEGKELLYSLPQSAVAEPESIQRKPGEVEAELVISRIGLSSPILTGCTEATLRRGACRILGTAVAGGLGNMAVAGHRDTNFRPLERLKVGDAITITDGAGRYEYFVNRTEIVLPDAVEVLEVGDRPELTLITCFPFRYIGAAPRRFIVHAYLRSVDGSAR